MTQSLVASLLLSLTIALGLALVLSTSTAASVKVVAGCDSRELSKKPRSMVFACASAGLRASNLSWLTWGEKRAKAKGEIFYKACVPNCATGGSRTRRGKVMLFGKSKCRPGLWSYTKARIRVWDGLTYRMKLWPCP